MLVEIMYRNQRTSGSGFLKIFGSERTFALLSVFFGKCSESKGNIQFPFTQTPYNKN
jgi:hypothetical protein